MNARWRRDAAVALAALLWLAATAGLRPLMLPDEGRYVGVAWEMLRSGDWLTPTLDGLPFFHKPPLFYWITAAAVRLFGAHDLAARAAPLLGAWGAALALFWFLRRWADEAAARLALVVLLVQPLFFVGGQFANLDMLVAGCITVTVLLAADAALAFEQGQPYRRSRLAAYGVAALGVLAKGLIGGVIPLFVIAAWLLARRRWRTLLALASWAGLALFVAIALPWFVLMEQRHPGFFDYFFVVQHFKRFAAAGFNNVQPFWFYPALLAAACLPWWPWGRGGPNGPLRGLFASWAIVVVLFFSWPQSKLVGYVLPALPPLAALFAQGALARGARRGLWAATAVSALVGVGIVVALAVHPVRSTREIASALAAERGADEPVFMLGGYFYDLAWYGRGSATVTVVDDAWAAPLRDDWRKELVDAGRFAPTLAQQRLIDGARLAAALCAAPVAWVIGPEQPAAAPWLAAAELRRSVRGTALWRVQAARLNPASCAGRPNGDPADR